MCPGFFRIFGRMKKAKDIDFSFIIPVYNRADELAELLASFVKTDKAKAAYEIIVADDGSTEDIQAVVNRFSGLPVMYFRQANAGPGAARNAAMERAKGKYFVILDSDVLLPADYFEKLIEAVEKHPQAGMLGGSDASDSGFTAFQKAVDLTMTSLCTTGGIRGAKKQAGRFVPRSFNMVVRRDVWEQTGGFSDMHPGEDPQWVYRAWDAGFSTVAVPDLKVFHKRRINLRSFWRQVLRFGRARAILTRQFPRYFSPVYLAPVFFVLWTLLAITGPGFFRWTWVAYALCAFVEFLIRSPHPLLALEALFLMLVQHTGYALGFLQGWFKLFILGKNPRQAFPGMFFAEKNKIKDA